MQAHLLRRLYPKAHISVDDSSNSIIVSADDQSIEKLRTVLAGIDIRNPLAARHGCDSLAARQSRGVVGSSESAFSQCAGYRRFFISRC